MTLNNKDLIEVKDNPQIKENSILVVDDICASLNIPRDILPDNESITYGLQNLNRQLSKVPNRLKGQEIVKLYVAASVGLYDDAILRIWNLVINELKNKINDFGLDMVKQVVKKYSRNGSNNYNENSLDQIKDADLLKLARQLNIISEEGKYKLDNCRDIRNNVSLAHYTEMEISDEEMIAFIKTCITHGLQDDFDVKGVNFNQLMNLLKSDSITEDEVETWTIEIKKTFDIQRELIWNLLFRNLTNPSEKQEVRINSMKIAQGLLNQNAISENSLAEMTEQYYDWKMLNKQDRVNAAMDIFTRLNIINNLGDPDKIAVLNKAIVNLHETHNGMNNFYNEPASAERLLDLSLKINPLPEVVVNNYVITNLQCYLGNSFGVSSAAQQYYLKMLKNLTPKGMEVLLKIHENDSSFKTQIFSNSIKRNRYIELLQAIENESLNDQQQHYRRDLVSQLEGF